MLDGKLIPLRNPKRKERTACHWLRSLFGGVELFWHTARGFFTLPYVGACNSLIVKLLQLFCIISATNYWIYNQLWYAENILEISTTTGIMVDPVYNVKAIRGMLHEMKNNPGRFKGHRILYVHTGKWQVEYATLIISYQVNQQIIFGF